MRGALAAAVVACAHTVAADPDPAPRFLPPRAGGEPAASRKDPTVYGGGPVLLPTAFTAINLHTAEALPFGPEASDEEPALLRRLLRDRTNWEEHTIDARSWATVRLAVSTLGSRRVELISGYRSEKLNERLRKKGHQVASHSQHTLGTAVDFRLGGVSTAALRAFVRANHRGGVGFYRNSGFVHVDTGPVRHWTGE